MVRAEILLSVVLAAIGAYLLIGVLRGPGRRGHGPGGARVEPTMPVGGAPDSGAAPAAPREAADRAAPGMVNGAAPAAPALPANRLPVPPLPAPDLPVRRSMSAPAARTVRSGVNNSRFARFDRSPRPASMASPYLRSPGPSGGTSR